MFCFEMQMRVDCLSVSNTGMGNARISIGSQNQSNYF